MHKGVWWSEYLNPDFLFFPHPMTLLISRNYCILAIIVQVFSSLVGFSFFLFAKGYTKFEKNKTIFFFSKFAFLHQRFAKR